ncbi:MAG: hypothetical protein PHN56_01370 [Candidatus Nanoarchaeia archaeon]|nr:hypothetical protein [Candidatus Nanoarchaeia archaeon]
MKIFRKTHFWKDNRTFIEIEAEEPRIEREYPIEGNFFLKIGEQSTIKSAFKLNPDEARALRDAVDMFLKVHDKKMAELMSNDFEKKDYTAAYSRDEYQAPKNEYSYTEPEKTNYREEYNPGPYGKKEYGKDEYTFKPEYGKEDYSPKPEYTKMPSQEKKPNDSFFIFGNDEQQPKKEEPKKPNVEFYF